MLRVLVLIGAFLFFRSVLTRKPKWSSTTITPYMNALDGALSAQQVSSVLDETIDYQSWRASCRVEASNESVEAAFGSHSIEHAEDAMSTAQCGQG
jgi:hypothetical protein